MEILDLHRTRHEDVESKTIRFIEEHWASGKEVEIITGNSHKMKGLVMVVLEEYGLKYQVGRQFDLNNMGYMVTWLE